MWANDDAQKKSWHNKGLQNFDLPKSQVGCQRLMGTNVVRLTDKSFMQELRKRIKEDYNSILQKRIAVREAKEIERERTLAISSRTGCIPQTLAGKPLNLSTQGINAVSKSRAKLKTNRERNAERLIRQGIKWERERLVSYELEKKRLLEAQKRREEELMIDRTAATMPNNSNRQYLHRKSQDASGGPKTQVEDSPATENKEGALDEEEDEDRDSEENVGDADTDSGDSDDLIHDDDDTVEDGADEAGSEDKQEFKGIATVEGGERTAINDPTSANALRNSSSNTGANTVLYTSSSSQGPSAIILSGDAIMERLMAAETVDELYLVAEEIIGKTRMTCVKNNNVLST